MPETMSLERRTLLAMLGAQTGADTGNRRNEGRHCPGGTTGQGNAQFLDSPAIREPGQPGDPSEDHRRGNLGRYGRPGRHPGGRSRHRRNDHRLLRSIKARKASFQAIAVEPKDSPVISQTLAGQPVKPGPHKIQGTGAGFIPKNLHLKDRRETRRSSNASRCTNDDAFAMARRLAKEEGILAGISSGANVWAAIEVAQTAREQRER